MDSATSGIYDGIFKAGISISCAIIVSSLIAFVITPRAQRKKSHETESSAFVCFVRDVLRHLVFSITELKCILEHLKLEKDSTEAIFRVTHLEKLRFTEGSSEFSHDLYKNASPSVVTEIHHLKLRLRNIEIDIDEMIATYKAADRDRVLADLNRLIFTT